MPVEELSSGPGIISTSNSGATWSTQTLPAFIESLAGISCPAITTCFAVGTIYNLSTETIVPTILSTTNSGQTWTDQLAPSGITSLTSISCASGTMTCFASGSGVIETIDGSTWTISITPGTTTFDSVECVDPSNCAVEGGATLLTSDNGGATWISQAVPSNVADLLEMTCFNTANCQSVGVGTNDGAIIMPFTNT